MQTKKINTINFGNYSDNYKSSTYKDQIKNVYFVDYINEEKLNLIQSWDLSQKKDNSIMGWLETNGDEEIPYDLYIGSNDEIKVGSYEYAFENLSKVETIDLNTEKVNTNELTDMSYMFDDANGLTTLDLSNWDTHNVTDMHWMFYDTSNLKSIDMRKATFSQVTNFDSMFSGTNSALQVTISGEENENWFKTNNVFPLSYYSDTQKLNVVTE